MARIIIFGGQGYLGQNIIRILSGNHKFLTLGRREEKLFNEMDYQHVSIYDSSLHAKLISFNADHFIVSYYGNPSARNLEAYNELNEIILELFKSLPNKPKLIFFSTQLVSDTWACFNSSDKRLVEPVDFYARMCFEFENQVMKLAAQNYLILRVPIVYGGEVDMHKGYKNIVFSFLNAAIKGDKLKVYGGGSQTRSFVHIEDFVLLLNHVVSDDIDVRILNACFGEHYSIRQLAIEISSKFDVECDFNSNWPGDSGASDLYDIRLESSKALSMVKSKWDLTKYLNSIDE